MTTPKQHHLAQVEKLGLGFISSAPDALPRAVAMLAHAIAALAAKR